MDRAYANLIPILKNLIAELDESAAFSTAATAASLAPVVPGLSTTLTEPSYYNGFDCTAGPGNRHNDSVVFASEAALFIALGVKEVASRGCNQVAVVAGAGGNGSSACIASDAVYLIALAAHTLLRSCDSEVGEAEIEGAFERTADNFWQSQ